MLRQTREPTSPSEVVLSHAHLKKEQRGCVNGEKKRIGQSLEAGGDGQDERKLVKGKGVNGVGCDW